MPLDGERLVIEPSYPNAEALTGMCGQKDVEYGPPPGFLRNVFYSHKMRCRINVWQDFAGRVHWIADPAIHHFGHDLTTLACSEAWGLEQEGNAVQLLGTLVRHRQLKQYLLTGMFVEMSKRSGHTYIFRKLRPTVVLHRSAGNEPLRIMCCLCMHPIAYYAGSWAGAMCPTDDVIAHLMLMRADEPMFWRRSNQHAPGTPEAGL